MARSLFAILAALSVAVAAAASSLRGSDPQPVVPTSCGSSSDHLKNLQIYLSPNPPVKGANFTAGASGKLDEEVTGGTIKVALKTGIIPLYSHTFDICTDLGIDCPIPAGPYGLNVTDVIPTFIPSGVKYHLQASSMDQNDETIFCMDAVVEL